MSFSWNEIWRRLILFADQFPIKQYYPGLVIFRRHVGKWCSFKVHSRLQIDELTTFKWMNTTCSFCVIVYNRDNVCDFLLTYPAPQDHFWKTSALKGKNWLPWGLKSFFSHWEHILHFRVDPFTKGAKEFENGNSSEGLSILLTITKTLLFKYIENFTSKNGKFLETKTPIFFIILLKT